MPNVLFTNECLWRNRLWCYFYGDTHQARWTPTLNMLESTIETKYNINLCVHSLADAAFTYYLVILPAQTSFLCLLGFRIFCLPKEPENAKPHWSRQSPKILNNTCAPDRSRTRNLNFATQIWFEKYCIQYPFFKVFETNHNFVFVETLEIIIGWFETWNLSGVSYSSRSWANPSIFHELLCFGLLCVSSLVDRTFVFCLNSRKHNTSSINL